MQFLGGRGYMDNNIAPQILRDARGLSITEGPNEPLTTQVGRKARHTDAIGDYLRSCPQGDRLADLLAASTAEIADRCLNAQGPFADRSMGQLWCDALTGQVASDLLLLSAARQAHAEVPSAHSSRVLEWAKLRVARTMQRARKGNPEERLIPTPKDVAELVELHSLTIGDVEQTLAGEEDSLDPLLARTPGLDPFRHLDRLPGQVVLSEEAKD